jgi:predicted dehydrogenase
VVFEDGTVGDITASELVMGGIYDFIEVFANNHRTRCRMSPVNVIDVYNPRHEQMKDIYLVEKLSSNEGWIPASPEEGWSLGYGRELRDFIRAIQTGTPPQSDLDLAIDITLTLYAGYVSADDKGREIAVPRL